MIKSIVAGLLFLSTQVAAEGITNLVTGNIYTPTGTEVTGKWSHNNNQNRNIFLVAKGVTAGWSTASKLFVRNCGTKTCTNSLKSYTFSLGSDDLYNGATWPLPDGEYDLYSSDSAWVKKSGPYTVRLGPAPPSSSTIVMDKTSYTAGEVMYINFDCGGVTPDPQDWVGIYPSTEIPDGTPAATTWQYANDGDQISGGSGVCVGQRVFPGTLGSGTWKAWYLKNDLYVAYGSSPTFTVAGTPPTSCSGTPATGSVSSNSHQYAVDGQIVDVVSFGSCYKPSTVNSNTIWADMRDTMGTDVWLWLGDNMYSDGTNLESKRQAYNTARDQSYYVSKGPIATPKIPVMGTWDDHDYGANNQGNDYTCPIESQNEFVKHFNVPSTDPMHASYSGGQRRGVYNARMFKKPDGTTNGVHVIMLDARIDRDPTYNTYGTCRGANTQMLSSTQWTWLDAELAKTSEIKIIGVGTQVLPPTDQTRTLSTYCSYDGTSGTFMSSIAAVGESNVWKGTIYESWGEIPQERAKLLQKCQKAINDGKTKQIIFVSGDQHWAEIMAKRMPTHATYGASQTLYEVTATGIHQLWNEAVQNSNRLRETSADNIGDGVFINECKFPFIYQSIEYISCTTAGGESVPWCATSVDNGNNYISGKWGYCADTANELSQNAESISTKTCTGSGYHICTATANYGAISVDWTNSKVRMSIRTPHHSGETEAAYHEIDL